MVLLAGALFLPLVVRQPSAPPIVAPLPLPLPPDVRPEHTGASAFVADGGRAYVTLESFDGATKLALYDVSSPAAPAFVGGTDFERELVGDVAVAAGHAYLARFQDQGPDTTPPAHVDVYRLTDPARPTKVASLPDMGDPSILPPAVEAADGTLYVLVGGDALKVYDLGDPAAPRLATTLTVPAHGDILARGPWLVLFGQADERASASEVVIMDRSQPLRPRVVATLRGLSYVAGLALDGAALYVARNGLSTRDISSVIKYDLTDPASPRRVGEWRLDGPAQLVGVAARDGRLYALDAGPDANRNEWSEVTALDWSTGAQPLAAGRIRLDVVAWGHLVTFPGGVLVGTADGLHVLSDDGSALLEVAGPRQTRSWVQDVAVAGDAVYLADRYRGLVTVDAADPAQPHPVHVTGLPAERVAVAAHRVYAAGAQHRAPDIFTGSGLQVFDVTVPLAPRLAGEMLDRWDIVWSLAATGDRVFAGVDFGRTGVAVVAAADPRQLQEVQRLPAPEAARGLAVAGGYLLWADESGLLSAADISHPDRAGEVVGGQVGVGGARALAAEGHLAALVQYMQLDLADITDPAHPAPRGTLDLAYAAGVAVRDGIVYVADAGGLRIVDARDPAAPVEVGALATPSAALAVAVSAGRAYVVHGDGLLVVDVTNAANPRVLGQLRLPG
jgi:hypothetical protein